MRNAGKVKDKGANMAAVEYYTTFIILSVAITLAQATSKYKYITSNCSYIDINCDISPKYK